jgi:superfamily II RNA helicase
MAIVYESKKDEWYKNLKEKSVVEMLHQASQEVEKIRVLERRLGIEPPIPSLDPKLSAAIWAWSKGCRFEELRNYTNISDGDLVRAFRLASDLLRQISRAIPEHEALRGRIRASIDRITRDVVDAEKQLRAGVSAG